jgi:hypothetical protein
MTLVSAAPGRAGRALAGVALGGLTLLGAAAAAPAPGTPADRTFVGSFVEAINTRSPTLRAALVHSKSRACASGEAGAWWADAAARQARDTLPPTFTWTITPLPAGRPPMFADKFDYPVRPTHLLQLDFETAPGQGMTIVLQLAKDGARWAEVVPCAKPETIVEARAARAARARQLERAKALAAGTSPELRDTVVGLFRAGRRLDAFETYARASGEDLATAKVVVEMLAEAAR